MELTFQLTLAAGYKGTTQKIRVLSEQWVSDQVYCPNCGNRDITRYKNNSPVADFYCSACHEDYELKGHGGTLGSRIVNGAYRTMMERLISRNNPNLMMLGYDHRSLEIRNLLVIPKHFFIPAIIEQRKPLSPTARRAGWVGCNIRLSEVPDAGRIFLIKDGVVEVAQDVLNRWRQTLFLRDQFDVNMKGWLLSVMKVIDRIRLETFSLDDVYAFQSELSLVYPQNRHIRPKIRQQLQVLRDKGYLIFLGNGFYRLANPSGPK
jgi:type II restriction enzyme